MNSEITIEDLQSDLESFSGDLKQVDRAILSVEAYSKLGDILQDNGPIDVATYELVEHSVESFLSLGGIGGIEIAKPSLEDYRSGEPSLEGIVSGIGKVFKAIYDAIIKAFKWFGNFIKKLFGFGKKVKEKSDENQEKIKDVGSWPTSFEVPDEKYLVPIVNSNGLMNEKVFDSLSLETLKTARAQELKLRSIKKSMPAFDAKHPKIAETTELSKLHTMPASPFSETNDKELQSKAIAVVAAGTKLQSKVYASQEFGGGVYVVVVDQVPKSSDYADFVEAVKGVGAAKINMNKPDVSKFMKLTGEQCSGEYWGRAAERMARAVKRAQAAASDLEKTAESIVKEMESAAGKSHGLWGGILGTDKIANAAKKGVDLITKTKHEREVRDALWYQLTLLRKTLDQPTGYMSIYLLQTWKGVEDFLSLLIKNAVSGGMSEEDSKKYVEDSLNRRTNKAKGPSKDTKASDKSD